MKCQYCGNNLGLEDEKCPYCGMINSQAAKHLSDMKSYKDDYDRTKEAIIKRTTRANNRTARLAIIAVMIMIVAVMLIINKSYYSFDKRIERNDKRIAENAEKSKSEISATIKEMEFHRDYLAMDYYVLNHRLNSNDDYKEYVRVFSAASSYEVIYSDIMNIVDGFDYYGEKTKEDWCKDIAIYIANWGLYVDGEFWKDPADSPMHAGEHGCFITDAKKDTQDMVQVYFKLTDEQASNMWSMEEAAIGEMLYEKCIDLYPEVKADE